ncbi:MAG: purine-nucleoside phosphorylase [Deltaproteobacteria bacterium HGW-Deltaproteobacteria-8]|nr:MAG: purine-nucleoside phosphorylase [Deltaproteobacteria bacterium HGW-Deltaproteobacteria-8]
MTKINLTNLDATRHSARFIREKLCNVQAGTLGLVLGSGLGAVSERITEFQDLPYSQIPGLPQSSIEGHGGFLRAGTLGGQSVLALCGRVHLYEGYTAAEACLPVRILYELGVRTLVLTNAAGALNPLFSAGTLMCVTDHINFSGQSPLTGPNAEEWGPRFPDLSRVWCPRLVALASAQARRLGLVLERGVYIQVAGPNLETPAETRAYRQFGADAIGMSTATEAIAATHMGMRLLGVSCLTNKNLPDCMAETSHQEVLDMASRAAQDMAQLLEAVAQVLPGLDESADMA